MILWATYPGYKYKGAHCKLKYHRLIIWFTGHRSFIETQIRRCAYPDPRCSSRKSILEAFELISTDPEDKEDRNIFLCDTKEEADNWVLAFIQNTSADLEYDSYLGWKTCGIRVSCLKVSTDVKEHRRALQQQPWKRRFISKRAKQIGINEHRQSKWIYCKPRF